MTPDSKRVNMMSLRFMVNQDIAREFKWEISVICDINRRNITYLNTTIEYCESRFMGPKHIILGFILEEINRKGNVPTECPLKANVMYEVFNFTLDPKYAPIIFPTLKWTTLLKFFFKNKIGLIIQLFGRLEKVK